MGIETLDVINDLRTAVMLAGDGGCDPFRREDYDAMYNLLEYLEDKLNTTGHI